MTKFKFPLDDTLLCGKNKHKTQITNYKTLVLAFVIGILVLLSQLCFDICHFSLYAQDSSKEQEALFVAKKAFEDGFYEVSLELLERFLKNYPVSGQTPQVNLLMGECYFHQNKFLDALGKFNQLFSLPAAKDIQDAVVYWIAEVHFRGNNFSKAAEFYQKIIDNFPKSSYAAVSYYSLGWCLFQEHAFTQALGYFKSVEEKFPKEPYAQDASFKIIECLYNLKDYTALKDKLKNYLKIYTKDTAKIAYLYFYMAEADYYLNNFVEAAQAYSQAKTFTADEKIKALCRLGAGWTHLKLKQYKEAENNFSQVQSDNLEKINQDILLLGKAVLSQETAAFSEAKNIYTQLINTTSDPVVLIQAYLGQADVLYNMAEYKDAISVYKEALTKISDSSPPQDMVDKLHYGLAWAHLKEGEFKEAIDEFQKVAKFSEDKIIKVSALCQIGDAYQDSGDFNKAIETYDGILKNYPDNFYTDYVQYQLGLILLKMSNYEGAIIAFKTLKANFPNSKLLDDATYALGLAYFQKDDYNSSKEIFEKFQSDFKDSNLKSQAMYLLGTSLYNLGKFTEAIEVFKNISKMYSLDAELSQKCEYEIADCFYRMGNEKEAMIRFKNLRSKYPDSKLTPEVMWWLGEYYYRQNDLSLARRYFSSLIQDFSKSNLICDAYYALGISYVEESKYEEAINNFKKVIELGRSDLAGTSSIAIADIYSKQEKLDLALKTYKDTVEGYQNLAHLIYPKIGEIYYRMGNYEEAIDYYKRSLDLVPVIQMSNIQFRIAEARQAQARPQEAIEEYLKVSYLYSENNDLVVKSLLRVAAIYEDKEDFKEALNIYKKIASMDVEEAKYAKEKIDWIRTHVK